MKRLLIIFSLLASNVTHAGREGGAGDSAEIEFKSIGRAISSKLHDELAGKLPGVDALKFQNAVAETQVIMTSRYLQKDGRKREALNFPNEKKIEVNRPNWTKLAPVRKAILVLHEYLGILGLEGESYEISSTLTSIMTEKSILKLVSDSMPIMEFTCELIRLNPMDARTHEVCGTSFILTTDILGASKNNPEKNPFRPSTSYFSRECDRIHVSLSPGFFGNYDVNLSQLESNESTPSQYAYFHANLYSPPAWFQLGLTLERGIQLLNRNAKTYELSCKLNSEEEQ
ncbi:MAG: hypothetical protein A4S09_13585 [Proteobacteria bacterium SG_bin7]|nr:MAG: hypothetical protein A4S09_13585 [Proteobacteria bacterium SG_bin7]